jgi:hypothetical protein
VRTGMRTRLVVLAALLAALAAAVSADAATPTNNSPPTISGNAFVGQTLTASTGDWSGKGLSFAYEWVRCSNTGGACASISGATSSTYKVVSADVGHTLRVEVTATNKDGTGTAQSAPTAVIQTAPVAPKATSLPSIAGSTVEGSTLTANNGNWSGSSPMTFDFRWQRCNSNGGNCSNLNATSQTYQLVAGDVGHTMRVLVKATNAGGSSTAVSAPTGVVQPATKAPSVTNAPSIAGTPTEGQTLTANNGNWAGTNPISFSFRWQLCDSHGNNCSNTNVTGQTYKLGAGDVGHTLRVRVVATNVSGSTSAVAAPTGVVQPVATPSGCVSISSVSSPQRLVVDQIASSPSRIHSRSEPLAMRFHVVSTSGRCVSGALVYAVGVPFDRLSHESEVQTGGDGWATVDFQILPTFQLRSGNLVVVFVRARKAGESLLAGVSTRRLVSVRVA